MVILGLLCEERSISICGVGVQETEQQPYLSGLLLWDHSQKEVF